MSLPIFKSDDRELMLLQTKWTSELNPVLALPLNSPSILKNISVSTGVNVINHKLGRNPIGYLLIDSNAAITLYRSAAFNDLTLTLTSSGSAQIALMVF